MQQVVLKDSSLATLVCSPRLKKILQETAMSGGTDMGLIAGMTNLVMENKDGVHQMGFMSREGAGRRKLMTTTESR